MTSAAAALLCAACLGCSLAADDGRRTPGVERLVTAPAVSDTGMVASSRADANRVGVEILAAGGNAVDAAIAVSLAVGVTDPGDSGLGGTVYMLVRMADGRVEVIDGSSPVPMRISRPALQRILDANQKSGPELASTPGALAGLELARRRFGTKSLAELIEPSIELAEAGYRLSPFQQASIARYLDDVRANEPLASIVLEGGVDPVPVGSLMRWPGMAATLKRIRDGGVDEFYRGAIAAAIEAHMIRVGGPVRRIDLAQVRGRRLEPLRGSYRGLEIISYPVPGAGAAVIEGLNILERFPPETLRSDSVERLQLLAEAFHLALDDHRSMQPDALIPHTSSAYWYMSKDRAAERAALIEFGRPVAREHFQGDSQDPELESQTVQVSVIDAAGNAVALTQTLGRFFGNKVVAADMGFLYNTFLGGADPQDPRKLRPGSVLPMDSAPTIVVSDGQPLLVLGSAGSSRIPGAVATVISNVVDREMGLAEAVVAPRVLWAKGRTTKGLLIEVLPPMTAALADGLEAMGYRPGMRVEPPAQYLELAKFGAVNAVHRDPATGRLTGVGDPRRDGAATGLP
jgi:gamma-glutamyltranspeptidase/glutathione hydrolase